MTRNPRTPYKCRLVRWINRRVTFQHIATVAQAGGIEVRSLVLLHPSFNFTEENKRIAA